MNGVSGMEIEKEKKTIVDREGIFFFFSVGYLSVF